MSTRPLRSVLEEGGGSIKTGPFGTVLSAAEYSDDGVPLISVGEIGYGEIRLRSTTPRIGNETLSRLPDYLLQAGDIVVGRKGGVDRSALIRDAEAGWFLGSDGIRVRFGPNVDAAFMAYYLLTPNVREWLLRHAGGSTLKSLNEPTLGAVPVRAPQIGEQRAIAEVLGALDDKIAANERIAHTAQLLTDTLGRELILNSERSGGVTIGEFADVVNGLAYRRSDLEEVASDNLVTLKSVTREGKYAERGLKGFRGVFKPEQRVTSGDIVVAQTDLTQAAEVVGRAVRLPRGGLGTGDAVASLDLAVVRPKGGLPPECLLAVLRDEQFRQHCLAHTSGTTVLHLRRGAIASYIMPRIDMVTHGSFVERARALNARQDAAAVESRQVAALRDALLPELMSGRLRVKDAEKSVEEVV